MEVNHIVLLKAKSTATPAELEELVAALHRLREQLPAGTVTSIEAGADFLVTRSKGYTHALVVKLPSKAALAAYAVDPLHVKLKEGLMAQLVEDVIAIDYMVERAPPATGPKAGSGSRVPSYGWLAAVSAIGVVVGIAIGGRFFPPSSSGSVAA